MADNTSDISLLDFPAELLVHIIAFLDNKRDIYACMMVNKELNRCSSDNMVWAMQLKSLIGKVPDNAHNNRIRYRDIIRHSTTSKALFAKGKFDLSKSDIHCDYNIEDHIIGYCYRGELEKLSKNADKIEVNKVSLYRSYVYYGNFSYPFMGKIIIKDGLYVPHIVEKNGRERNTPALVLANTEAAGTPLHWACICGHEKVVRYLLDTFSDEIDVDIKIKKHNATALKVAQSNGHLEIARLLRQFKRMKRRKNRRD
mmetsp:Transcript_29941/g.33420  ORF Transcript_29941/g.33420 Transcript_29941/m.33420 type:complete len:256 (-) Transcript_29941:126-893(-)